MFTTIKDTTYEIRILKDPEEIEPIEDLQRIIWPGNETDIVPAHMLITFAHNGGLVLGCYIADSNHSDDLAGSNDRASKDSKLPAEAIMVGFAFGFPGLYASDGGARMKHCSHQLGVLPEFQNHGIGFILKRAQWQMVRNQNLSLITWTYDPLQSRNANLNISRLGAICDTYICDAYGEMRDDLNVGVSSDRFQVELWVNSHRVRRRFSNKVRSRLDLDQYLEGGAEIVNPATWTEWGFPVPGEKGLLDKHVDTRKSADRSPILLVEIPSEIEKVKLYDMKLAQQWRLHTREYFSVLFESGYIITDFIYQSGDSPRSFYVLVHGESTL